MATPTEKHTELDALLNMFTGRNRKDTITADKCTICGGDAKDFKDALSRKEYTISGMCQCCQDRVFG